MQSVNEGGLGADIESAIADRLRELGLEVHRPEGDQGAADLVARLPGTDLRWEVDVKTQPPARPPVRREGLEVPRVIGVPHVTRARARSLRSWDLFFVDTAGNCWIEGQGVKLWVEGRSRVVEAAVGRDRPSRAFTPTGLRTVLVLLTRPELTEAPVRALADAAGVSVGAAQQARADLAAEGLVRSVHGRQVLVDPGKLAARWVEGHGSRLLPRLRTALRVGPDPQWWCDRATSLTQSWLSGDAGLMMHGLGPRHARHTVIYGRPPWPEAKKVGRLREHRGDEGEVSTVTLREVFWSPAGLADRGRAVAPPLVVYADAIHSGDARLVELAGQMWENDEDLRRLR